ncbi:transposase [uncultured Sutterella sp.]|uniref:transposase n=1 Tax=uncultured Sutterella sp. TaxID=286133 RepID=UPI003439229A
MHHLRTCGVLGKVYDALLGTLPDRGQQGKVKHSAKDLLTQRLMGLMVGKEDLCDTDQLAADPGFMLAIGRDRLASTATLSRFEQKARRSACGPSGHQCEDRETEEDDG